MNLLAMVELGEHPSSQIPQLFIACLASSSYVTRLYNSRDTVLGLVDSYELDSSRESFVYWNLRLYWFFWMDRLGQAFQM